MIARGFPADNLSKIGSTDFAVLRNTARIPMSDNTGGLAIILKKKKKREKLPVGWLHGYELGSIQYSHDSG